MLPRRRPLLHRARSRSLYISSRGYAEVKTPRSVRKVADRLKHASEQLNANGSSEGDVYLSLLRLGSEERRAIDVAQRFGDYGTIKNLRVIHSDGITETLNKTDAGLGS